MSSIIRIQKFKEVLIWLDIAKKKKRLHLDRYGVSGKCKTEYARENNIPEATFRTWVKEATYANFKNPNFIRVFS